MMMNSEQLISTNQHICRILRRQHFCPLKPLKPSDQGPRKAGGQGTFSPTKILDPGRKHFYRQYISEYPLQATEALDTALFYCFCSLCLLQLLLPYCISFSCYSSCYCISFSCYILFSVRSRESIRAGKFEGLAR